MKYCYCLTTVDGSLLALAAHRCCRETRTPTTKRFLSYGVRDSLQTPVSYRTLRARPQRRNTVRARMHPRRHLPTISTHAFLFHEKPVSTDLHPNQREIDGLYANLYLLTEAEIYRLSDTWIEGRAHRVARDCALHPDTPAVPEALRLLLALPVIIPAYVPESIRARAVSALADAVIAVYGRPQLNPAQYRILMRAYWHAVTSS